MHHTPVNISANVGHLHIASDYEATCEVQTMFRICLQQLMITSKCIAEHLIQPVDTYIYTHYVTLSTVRKFIQPKSMLTTSVVHNQILWLLKNAVFNSSVY